MSADMTATGFDELAAKLAALDVTELATPIVTKAGVEMKKRMRADARGHKHAPRLPYAISFDIKRGVNTVEAVAGPRRGGAGSLAMYWLGNANMAPVLPHPDRYAKEQAEQTVKHLATAIRKALR